MKSPRIPALLLTATLLAWAPYGLPGAFAQPDQPGATAGRPRGEHSGQPPRGEHHRGAWFGRLPGAHLFRPLPEDQGPLTPEEQQQLLEFIGQHAPELYGSLERLRTKNPNAFEQRLQKALPHLRRLRRIFERDPELGRSVMRHSENVQRLRRARRAWLDSVADRAARRGIEDVMRRTVAENVAIETAVLEDQVRELDLRRDARIAAEFERLMSEDIDLASEPPEIRELLRRLHDAQWKGELEWLEDDLWLVCAARMDREVRALQGRVERMRADTAAEVDRRIKQLTSPAESGERHGGERKHSRRPRP